MNYTENYHLPQWVKSDRIMMEDFNTAMAGIEGGITEAQATADAAQTKANAAYSPDQKPYVVGSYTGTGQPLTINVGFRPSFLIITNVEQFSTSVPYPAVAYGGQTGGNTMTRFITLTDTGFQVHLVEGLNPNLSAEQRVYDYIAFR